MEEEEEEEFFVFIGYCTDSEALVFVHVCAGIVLGVLLLLLLLLLLRDVES